MENKEENMFDTEQLYSNGLWQVKNGKEIFFMALWKEFAETGLKNEGVIEAALLQGVDNPNNFVSFGQWENAEAAQKWQNSSAFKEYMAKFKELCDSMQIKILKSVIKVKK